MMRPDELQTKMKAVERLRLAVVRLETVEAITSGQLYFSGHESSKFSPDEVTIVRKALIEHYRNDVEIKAAYLRNSGVDPSSLMPKVAS